MYMIPCPVDIMAAAIPATHAVPAPAVEHPEDGAEIDLGEVPGLSPLRAGPWNAQADKMLQSGVLAARLGGGGTVTVTYGHIKMTVEVKHERAAGLPKLASETQELRLRAVEAQRRRQDAAAAADAAAQQQRRLVTKLD